VCRLLSLGLRHLLLLRGRRRRREWQKGGTGVATNIRAAAVATECSVNP
jgi:hypothetical protein